MTRILVVEDEESFSDPLSYLLRREGYEVAVADDGPAALEEFDRNGADLVLLDLMLPGLPGTEVCRQLRVRSKVPVIMLTAKDGEIDKVVGLELGADDYVTKPFSPRELLARIRAVLRRRQTGVRQGRPEGVRAYRFDGWELNLNTRRLRTREGEIVPLSNGEFSLLLVFLGAGNRVLSRDQLLDLSRLHGDDTYNRSVNTQVLRLRRKLARGPQQSAYIRTERGAGYVFSVPIEIVY